jgi:iron(III) transport system substrate-binding protein
LQEWSDLIVAAQAEGALSLVSWVGRGYQATVDAFQQLFPGIAVDWLPESNASVWLERARREHSRGAVSFDVALAQPDLALRTGLPLGMWADLRSLLFHPDVLGAPWRDGFDARFLDDPGSYCFNWEYQVIHAYAVNTDLVDPSEISSVADLLDPRWTGKIMSYDPRSGMGLQSAASVSRAWGDETVRRLLLDQRPARATSAAQLAEAVIDGRYPIGMGVRPKALQPFRDEGVRVPVRLLDLPDADFVATTSLLHFANAPHPAAARLFANWVLTHKAQTILAGQARTNSARADVQVFEPHSVASAATYYEPDRQSNHAHTARVEQLVRSYLS